MYEIIKNGHVIELQEALTWVRKQSNGVIVTCDAIDGAGILSGNQETLYSVIGKPQLEDYEFVEVREIKWYPVSEQQRADIDYIAIMTEVEL